MSSFEKKLPLERWQQIMAEVSHGDLCNLMLTSRHMNSVASWPHMWAGMRVNMGKVREEGLAPLYSIKRFKKFGKSMRFDGMRLTTVELERILNDIPASPLENVNFEWNYLSGVSPELLASAVQSLNIVNLSNTQLSLNQCNKLLEASLNSKTLAHLNLTRVALNGHTYIGGYRGKWEVLPDLLASAVQRLTSVNLTRTSLTSGQCNKLLEASLNSTTLDHLDLSGVDLSAISPDLLISAAKRLKTINLQLTHLTEDQCNKVREASLSSTRLADLVSFGAFDRHINDSYN